MRGERERDDAEPRDDRNGDDHEPRPEHPGGPRQEYWSVATPTPLRLAWNSDSHSSTPAAAAAKNATGWGVGQPIAQVPPRMSRMRAHRQVIATPANATTSAPAARSPGAECPGSR